MGVALAEWSRHFVENTDPALATVPVRRTVWRLTLDIPRVLDMRDSAVWTDLSLTDAPHCFLDLAVAQTVGGYVRRITDAQALLVPSVAMLNRDSLFPTDHVGAWQDVGRHVLDDLREEALDYAAT